MLYRVRVRFLPLGQGRLLPVGMSAPPPVPISSLGRSSAGASCWAAAVTRLQQLNSELLLTTRAETRVAVENTCSPCCELRDLLEKRPD